MTNMTLEQTEVNIPLLRKAVEWVEAEATRPVQERAWVQDEWVMTEPDRLRFLEHQAGCGTAYCVAGWVAAQAHPELADAPSAVVDGERLYSWSVAQQTLGLLDGQADVLFAATNSASDVRKTAEWIAGERL